MTPAADPELPVCERSTRSAGDDPSWRPDLLIEVPHGATLARHFDDLRRRLRGSYPDDLREFFFVNTDVGAPECAEAIASGFVERAAARGIDRAKAVVLRGLVPRTFIDVNRILDGEAPEYSGTGLTPGLPQYVTDPADAATLRALHDRYHDAAKEAYEAACGSGGLALILHTYAPRSIDVGRIDANVVQALHAAYRPDRYAAWPARPDVEIIDRTPDDESLADPALVSALEAAFAAVGITVARNVTYRLDPRTTGHRHSARYPGRVLCLELNRARLADPFEPFREMRIGEAKVARMAGPIADALAGVRFGPR